MTLSRSVSQTVVRGPQVALGFYPYGPLRLNISPKKDRKNQINMNCVSHTVVENLKQFAFKGEKSRVVRRTFCLIKVVPTWKSLRNAALRKSEDNWDIKEEALARTVWRNRFGRGYGPFVIQKTQLMNTYEELYGNQHSLVASTIPVQHSVDSVSAAYRPSVITVIIAVSFVILTTSPSCEVTTPHQTPTKRSYGGGKWRPWSTSKKIANKRNLGVVTAYGRNGIIQM
jgi:hypothetical protein